MTRAMIVVMVVLAGCVEPPPEPCEIPVGAELWVHQVHEWRTDTGDLETLEIWQQVPIRPGAITTTESLELVRDALTSWTAWRSKWKLHGPELVMTADPVLENTTYHQAGVVLGPELAAVLGLGDSAIAHHVGGAGEVLVSATEVCP